MTTIVGMLIVSVLRLKAVAVYLSREIVITAKIVKVDAVFTASANVIASTPIAGPRLSSPVAKSLAHRHSVSEQPTPQALYR